VIVEAAVESIEAALAAEQGGADRLELCADLSVGGTTPSTELLTAVKARVGIPVFVMVRPRGGSFVYSAPELDRMRREVDALASLGADGVVLGVLNAVGAVDEARTRELVARVRPLPTTFHRAFDVAPDPVAALERLVDCGVERVLTGGGPGTALDGLEVLCGLVDRAGGRIAIMAGGSVRAQNVQEIATATGVREVHARCELDPERIRGIKIALSS
jgi:copper homeostasis protein